MSLLTVTQCVVVFIHHRFFLSCVSSLNCPGFGRGFLDRGRARAHMHPMFLDPFAPDTDALIDQEREAARWRPEKETSVEKDRASSSGNV